MRHSFPSTYALSFLNTTTSVRYFEHACATKMELAILLRMQYLRQIRVLQSKRRVRGHETRLQVLRSEEAIRTSVFTTTSQELHTTATISDMTHLQDGQLTSLQDNRRVFPLYHTSDGRCTRTLC